MIIELWRGHVRLKIGERVITIQGEVYLRGYGSPDFVAYRNTILRWDEPVSQDLTPEEKELVERVLQSDFKAMGMTVEIE